MMHKYADLYATVGKWTGDDGRSHKRKLRVGVVMRDDRSGKLAIRIKALPEFSGWLSVVRFTEDGELR